MTSPAVREHVRVAVVGGGPAGLSAATRLRDLGIDGVVVFEREAAAGGIPRHCGHPPFGMREFKTCLTGPAYASRLVRRALGSGVEIRTGATVAHCGEGGRLTISSAAGQSEVQAERVLLATGVRETPRSARLVGGTRPLGVLSTGALQALVYLKSMSPFRRPLIVGSELVAFSALLTCRHLGIRPVAMLEERPRVTARGFCAGLPWLLGVPLLKGSRLTAIEGKDRVTGARYLDADGRERRIACDGVLFTGRFTPESTLIRMGHLDLNSNSGGPAVDSLGRCSDPRYFAAGNLLRPVETAGWCWAEGRLVAETLADSLRGDATADLEPILLQEGDPIIRFVTPNRVWASFRKGLPVQLRFAADGRGCLTVSQNGKELWRKTLTARPERRVLLPREAFRDAVAGQAITVGFRTAGT